MAGKGRHFEFHGAFKRKETADYRAELVKLTSGGRAFVRRIRVRGEVRYVVLVPR